MKKEKRQRPRLEDIIPNAEYRKEVLQALYGGGDLFGKESIFSKMLQTMVDAALEGEMDAHLASDADSSSSSSSSGEDQSKEKNRRNGHLPKKVRSKAGPLEIHTPRDRQGSFEPTIVGKWDRELHTGFDEMILYMYGQGQSIENIRQHLELMYGIELSAGAISAVTNRVWNTIVEWQERPLQSCYAIIYLDGIYFKVKQDGQYVTKVLLNAYSVDLEGNRDLLGLYIAESESIRSWGMLLADLKRRGVEDVLYFCVDGLAAFKQVVEEYFTLSIVQRCIVHMIRSSTKLVPDKDMKAVCAGLRKVYTAANEEQALIALKAFKEKWDQHYPEVSRKWDETWEDLIPFLAMQSHIRRLIYTTNPIEALHRQMRKVTKTKGAWIDEKALFKQIYLALMNNEKGWKRSVFNWKPIQRELVEYFGDRVKKWLSPQN
jgi:putative transposase